MKLQYILILAALSAAAVPGQELSCDMAGYKPQEGLKAQIAGRRAGADMARRARRSIARVLHHPRRPARRAGASSQERTAEVGSCLDAT